MHAATNPSPFYDRIAAQVNGRGASLDVAIDKLVTSLDALAGVSPDNADALAAEFDAALEAVHGALPRFLADLGYLQQSAQFGDRGEPHDPEEDTPAALDYVLLRDAAPVFLSTHQGIPPPLAAAAACRTTLRRLQQYVRRQSWRPEITRRIPTRSHPSQPSPIGE
jgi:hypothetical protein